jgi:membrane-associated phospholipid phosphatase
MSRSNSVNTRFDVSIEQQTGISDQSSSSNIQENDPPSVPSRRAFLKGLGALTLAGAVPTAAIAANTTMPDVLSDTHAPQLDLEARPNQAYRKKLAAASEDRQIRTPSHLNNGDEILFPNGTANFTKGLAHPRPCIVDPEIYAQYLSAIHTGKRADFDAIVTGGVPLVDPQAGLAFDLETCDPSQNSIPPFATLTSKNLASQMVEAYWMALTRDVPFSQWDSDSTVAAACTELTGLSAFTGPRIDGQVTAQSLFRGFPQTDVLGPYVSQFFIQPFTYGVLPFVGYLTTLPGDFITDPASWNSLQDGVKTTAKENPDPNFKYLGDGRDLAEYVHNDVLYQEYLNAALMLATMGAPLNSGNPYYSLKSETGFITFGLPMLQVLVAEVVARAIKNAWFQKWFVHRMARPEETAGLVHYMKTAGTNFFLDNSVVNSRAAATVENRTGNYFIPLSYPEGCPLHPSYPSGHATAAGAAVTILKWFFNDSTPISQLTTPLTTTEDGSKPVPYGGSDADQLTVGGELNKLASNVGFGRVFSGIHWRDDIKWGMLLGEQVAINLLRDQAHLYNENYTGFTFTKFDGMTKVTV